LTLQRTKKPAVELSSDTRPDLALERSAAFCSDSKVAQDRSLVDRCVAGEVAAWSALYHKFHDSLLIGIRAFLGRVGQDANLIDEIAARVWYALVKNNSELLGKFDVRRGCRFSTFLSLVAKSEARLLLRSEKRRRRRELVVSKLEADRSTGHESVVWLSDEEFVMTLSPAERAFYFDVLMVGQTNGNSSDYSEQNRWQLRHRIRKKLERFIAQRS